MLEGFDFTTRDVLDEELNAIQLALDADAIRISRHAASEAFNDGLTADDLLDTVAFHDTAAKDLPGNALGRAPGINFERLLGPRARHRVKVGWKPNGGFYVIVTTMIL